MTDRRHEVAIVGAGFAGIGMAIRLKQAGRDDFVVIEQADNVGGTWRDNTYPGCACDIPSHLYSLSFAPNANWSRRYPTQQEIQAYLEDCVARFGLRPHLRLSNIHI
jgi:cation diffusion facilitator CzcD-associated flavoprotein CzcO